MLRPYEGETLDGHLYSEGGLSNRIIQYGIPDREGKSNVRFWIFVNQGPVKITLRPGQRLERVTFGRTDEGWSRGTSIWEHEFDKVTQSFSSDGYDCDGRMERFTDHTCELHALHHRLYEPHDGEPQEDVYWPRWENVDSWQRDHEAEKAGY